VPERRGGRGPNPLRAAALRYDEGTTPRVVAAGRGEVARRIVEEARAAGVPVRDDAGLAEALVWAYRMDLGALKEARRD